MRSALKDIPYELVFVHLVKDGGHHKRPEYSAVNPQMRVPALVLSSGETLIQSMAIIEYLDEVYPDPPLLPAEAIERARVRAVAQIVACDIHPLNNSGTMAYLRKIGHDDDMINEWYAYWVTSGFEAIEAMIKPGALRVRLACHARRHMPHSANLQCAPLQGAARSLPEDLGVEAACNKLPAFDKARPENQPDAE